MYSVVAAIGPFKNSTISWIPSTLSPFINFFLLPLPPCVTSQKVTNQELIVLIYIVRLLCNWLH